MKNDDVNAERKSSADAASENDDRREVLNSFITNLAATLAIFGLVFLVLGSLHKLVARLGQRIENRTTTEVNRNG